MRRLQWLILALLMLRLGSASWAQEGIRVDITVLNTTDEMKTVNVSQALPRGLSSEDYVRLDDGASLRYHPDDKRYYLHRQVVLDRKSLQRSHVDIKGEKFEKVLKSLSPLKQEDENGTFVLLSYRPLRPDFLIEVETDGALSLDGQQMSDDELRSRLSQMDLTHKLLVIRCSRDQQEVGNRLYDHIMRAEHAPMAAAWFGASMQDTYSTRGFDRVDALIKRVPARFTITLLQNGYVSFLGKTVTSETLPPLLLQQGAVSSDTVDVGLAPGASLKEAARLEREFSKAECGHIGKVRRLSDVEVQNQTSGGDVQ